MRDGLSSDRASPGKNPVARLAAWIKRGSGGAEDRRRATRVTAKRLCAYYWDGGTPIPHEILNISEAGACFRATKHWPSGTVIELTIQGMPGTNGALAGPHEALKLPAKVVHSTPDVIGVRFLYTRPRERLHIRELLAAVQSEGTDSSSGGAKRRGQALIEFALVALFFLWIIFVSFDFFFWVYAKAALHGAVREGARYAITGQTTGSHQDDSIRQVVRNNAFGLLDSAPAGTIGVEYFAADGSGSTGSNAAGNIIVVSVLDYTPATLAPLLGFSYPIRINVRAVDKVEPFSGAPPPR